MPEKWVFFEKDGVLEFREPSGEQAVAPPIANQGINQAAPNCIVKTIHEVVEERLELGMPPNVSELQKNS